MESCVSTVVSTDYTDARRVMSECWIFTEKRGLRPMTLHGNGSALAIDGQRLIRWCILDDSVQRSIVAYLYCAERPNTVLRDQVSELARARFAASHRTNMKPEPS